MSEAGMYAVFENMEGNVVIGKYTMCKQSEGKIWIQENDGDGGEFCEKEIEKLIENFYNKNF